MAGTKGGWYPRDALKGGFPVAAEVWLLCAYSIHESCSLHVDWLWEETQRRLKLPGSLLRLSIALWVKDDDERLTFAPRAEQKSFHTRDVNCSPLSETMSSGNTHLFREPEHVGGEVPGRLQGSGKFRKGDEISCFGGRQWLGL